MMMSDKPAHQNAAEPDFWDKRYRQGTTPWEAGRVPAALVEWAASRPPQRVLVPGCGSAREVEFLCELGWDVTAVDFSEAAVDAARKNLGPWGDRVQLGDFFTFAAPRPFDVIYERAFLCAIPRRLWQGYGPRCAELLVPGGLLAGFFYFGEDLKGPPFAIEPAQLEVLLVPRFARIEDAPVADSIPVFKDRERWQVWQRR